MVLTFDLRTSRDCLEDLRGAIADFKKDPLNPRIARYCSIVAWSISDWVFEECAHRLEHKRRSDFQQDIKSQCPELGYLQDLGTSVKHMTISRYIPSLVEARMRGGAFSNAFSNAFDRGGLILSIRDGRHFWFDEVIQTALSFWDKYFNDLGL